MRVYFSARMTLAVGMLAAMVWPSIAIARQQPPLAEVARQEAERRKSTKTTQKVITTKDLPESAKRAPGAAPAESAGAPAAAPSTAGQAPVAGPGAGDKGTEEQWRGRINEARESVRRNEAFAVALQSRINGLTRDFVNRDNPVQRRQVGEDREK